MLLYPLKHRMSFGLLNLISVFCRLHKSMFLSMVYLLCFRFCFLNLDPGLGYQCGKSFMYFFLPGSFFFGFLLAFASSDFFFPWLLNSHVASLKAVCQFSMTLSRSECVMKNVESLLTIAVYSIAVFGMS